MSYRTDPKNSLSKLTWRARGKCQALGENGKQCNAAAFVSTTFSGDSETSGGWVRVLLCIEHARTLEFFDTADIAALQKRKPR